MQAYIDEFAPKAEDGRPRYVPAEPRVCKHGKRRPEFRRDGTCLGVICSLHNFGLRWLFHFETIFVLLRALDVGGLELLQVHVHEDAAAELLLGQGPAARPHDAGHDQQGRVRTLRMGISNFMKVDYFWIEACDLDKANDSHYI